MSISRSTLNISLTPELGQFVSSRVASGRYLTASEVIREALRLLEEQERVREMRIEELQSQIKVGIDQLDRGEAIDGKDVFKEVKEKIKRKRAA